MEKLLYALKEEKLVSIEDVCSGKGCGCICPGCKQPLIAKKGNILIHHFAHASGIDCKRGFESSLHLLAKDIISECGFITLPDISVNFGNPGLIQLDSYKTIVIDKVYIEKSFDDVKPDIAIHSGKEMYFIEIYVTHKIDENKFNKLKQKGISTIEIDLSDLKREINHNTSNIEPQKLKNKLKNILINETTRKYWAYHNKIEQLKEDSLNKLKLNLFHYQKISDIEFVKGCPSLEFDNKKYRKLEECKSCEYCLKIAKHKIYCLAKIQELEKKSKSFKTKSRSNIELIDFRQSQPGEKVILNNSVNRYVAMCPIKELNKKSIDDRTFSYLDDCLNCKYFKTINDDKFLVCNAELSNPVEQCPRCKSRLIKRYSKYGEFYGCEKYPSCTYKKGIPKY